jgi:hypothetical protein
MPSSPKPRREAPAIAYSAEADNLAPHLAPTPGRTESPRKRLTALTCYYSVELRGFEPLTPSMPWRCATSCATAPVSPIPASLDRISIPAARACSHQPGPALRRRRLQAQGQADGNGHRRADAGAHRLDNATDVTDRGSPCRATAGCCRAVVQRSVQDLTSLQYQRMSAHAWLPSGTRRPSGSVTPHMEHPATSSGRSPPSSGSGAGEFTGASQGLGGSGSGCLTCCKVSTDVASDAMTPPRGTGHEGLPGPGTAARGSARDSYLQARSYQARSWVAKLAHTKPAQPP